KMAKDLLLEIGLEEMPAHVVTPSMKQLEEKTAKFLDENQLTYTFLTLPIVKKHLDQFKQTLPQPISFSYSIKNMVLFNASYVLG
ncbi:glycine--tRNA ligase subunit beta, partial [Enterococcus faecium]|uniref:glycine--tRNA ligase subunit beta n=1 Tax=Enterococcus faecium TaxID=1352 RepID=UPI0037C18DFD